MQLIEYEEMRIIFFGLVQQKIYLALENSSGKVVHILSKQTDIEKTYACLLSI